MIAVTIILGYKCANSEVNIAYNELIDSAPQSPSSRYIMTIIGGRPINPLWAH